MLDSVVRVEERVETLKARLAATPASTLPRASPEALPLNVIMLGTDSMSRNSWRRYIPKTYNYFVDVLKGVVLEGYNIVGDGTPQALLPILTGAVSANFMPFFSAIVHTVIRCTCNTLRLRRYEPTDGMV